MADHNTIILYSMLNSTSMLLLNQRFLGEIAITWDIVNDALMTESEGIEKSLLMRAKESEKPDLRLNIK